jgi:uncharacterized membrane protein
MFVGLEILFTVCVAIVPIIAIITGFLMKTNPPKKINNAVGYRTRRSKASQEAWDFANVYCGKNTFIYGIISLIISIAAYLFMTRSAGMGMMSSMYIVMAVQVVALIVVMAVPTEKKLKDKFGE